MQLAINRIGQLPDAVDPQVHHLSLRRPPGHPDRCDQRPRPARSPRARATTLDLKTLDDVRDATLLGDARQRITITPDPDALAAGGLSQQAIRDALDANGVLLPAGTITEGDQTLTVQAGARIASTTSRRCRCSAPSPGRRSPATFLPGRHSDVGSASPVRATTIADVATVELVDDPVTGISRVNGEPALTIAITKPPAGNTVEVSNAVRERCPTSRRRSATNRAKFTVVFDQAPFIEQSIESLANEGLLGLLFAVIVIFVFLLSFGRPS